MTPSSTKIGIITNIGIVLLILAFIFTSHEIYIAEHTPVLEWKTVQEYTLMLDAGATGTQPITTMDAARTIGQRFTVTTDFPVNVGRTHGPATYVTTTTPPPLYDCAVTQITAGTMTCKPNGDPFSSMIVVDQRRPVNPVVDTLTKMVLHTAGEVARSNSVHVKNEVLYCTENCEHLDEWMKENIKQ